MSRSTVRSCIISIALIWNCRALAQSQIDASRFGGYVDGALNAHAANFQTLPGVPSCCPRYENGNGIGLQAGAFYDIESSPWLGLQLRLGFSQLGATLKTAEFTTVLDAGGNSAQGEFEHSVQASIGVIALSPLVKFHLDRSLAVLAGPTVGWVAYNSYNEKETLVQPNFGTFENGLRERNVFSGPTPGASKVYLGVTAGVQYRLPLNREGSLFAIPEVFGTYGISALVPGMNWRASSISGGISLEYRPFTSTPLPITAPKPFSPPPVAQPVPKPPLLTAALSVSTLDSSKEVPLKELVIEDYIRTQYRPLLNYIFFDSASSRIPARYRFLSRHETHGYDFKTFSELGTLPLYYEVLNIVGKRLQEFPHARLRIVGCAGNGRPRGLAHDRAEAVYRYLVDVWSIDSNRLQLESRGLPEKPSNPNDSDGEAENRRTELYSTTPQILEPIFTIDTAHVPKPSIIRFLPRGTAEAGLASWDIATTEGPLKLKDFSGTGALVSHLDWDLTKEREAELANLDTVQATLVVDDKSGREAQSNVVPVPVRHYTLLDKHRIGSTDTIISRYSLILFDFDRSELGEANRRIADFVKARISDKSKVEILGYTDRMGSTEYNQKLSAARATATERYIGVHAASVRGLGRSTLLYDNTLPEGRFYSRTVTVIVTTPTVR